MSIGSSAEGRVTDERYLQASKEAVQNPVQQASGNPGNPRQETQQPLESPKISRGCQSVHGLRWAALDSNQRLPPCERRDRIHICYVPTTYDDW